MYVGRLRSFYSDSCRGHFAKLVVLFVAIAVLMTVVVSFMEQNSYIRV